jgi:hypothetical protein
MNNASILITGIDVVAVAGLRRRRGAHRCRGNRAEEDPVRQDEEGVVQAASGVAPLHPSNSSSSVAVAVTAVAAIAAVAVAVAVAAAVR